VQVDFLTPRSVDLHVIVLQFIKEVTVIGRYDKAPYARLAQAVNGPGKVWDHCRHGLLSDHSHSGLAHSVNILRSDED
jgi:hypothetical protein